MLIQDMTADACRALLAKTHIGRLACAEREQPYVTPFSFVYRDQSIYSFAMLGKKVEWMRANPRVCVQIDQIVSREAWQSVVIFGRYDELPDTPDRHVERAAAHDLLAAFPEWWKPGYARTLHDGIERRLEPIFFRIVVDEISGHEAIAGA